MLTKLTASNVPKLFALFFPNVVTLSAIGAELLTEPVLPSRPNIRFTERRLTLGVLWQELGELSNTWNSNIVDWMIDPGLRIEYMIPNAPHVNRCPYHHHEQDFYLEGDYDRLTANCPNIMKDCFGTHIWCYVGMMDMLYFIGLAILQSIKIAKFNSYLSSKIDIFFCYSSALIKSYCWYLSITNELPLYLIFKHFFVEIHLQMLNSKHFKT